LPSPSIIDLSCQYPDGLIGIGAEPIRLNWKVGPAEGGLRQLGYELHCSTTQGFDEVLATTGEVRGSEQIAITDPGPALASREGRFYRVRIETDDGWSDWSPVLAIEAGLRRASDWEAKAITMPDDAGETRQAPCPLLRCEFELGAGVKRARLHVTSLGVHQVSMNGRRVSDELLNPGWSTYGQRLLAATYDVTDLLVVGGNVISAVLGDGWYRGRLGWSPDDDRGHYGRQLGLIGQLEVDLDDGSSMRLVTDETWSASTGEFQAADLYDGSVIDLRRRQHGWDQPGFDDVGWVPAQVVPYDSSVIEPRTASPVRVVATLDADVRVLGEGSYAIDGGQNIAGFVRLRVSGEPGDEVIVGHAEVLEPDGSLHTRSLRSAKATDRYVLAEEGHVDLEPIFTFHGFRYAEIHTDADILAVEIVVISSDLEPRSRFECSDDSLNRLHENVVWSQRDNFVSVPTDCPQRDERLGWTGDAQAFAATACTLFDAQAFWSSWLKDLSLDQDDELGVPSVVPDVVLDGEPRYGRAGWADAATIVPWSVYESYGDPAVLHQQLDSMRRWVDSLVDRRGPDGLLPEAMQFGDWLDPDAPSDRPWEAKADSTFLANAFFAHSAGLVADAGAVTGQSAEFVSRYRSVSEEMARLTWERWRGHIVETQTGCAVAIQFGIAPEDQRPAIGESLAQMVREAGGRVSTGFLGTPLVLPAMAQTGNFDEAYSMLMRRQYPSWLYQVEMGATTVWERWDAIRPDGSIHPGGIATPPGMEEDEGVQGHMLSFNHYAYGAVIDWVYRHLAGLAPDRSRPGYRHIVFAPRPVSGVDWAKAAVDTPLGPTSISWLMTSDGALEAEVELPFGATGEFRAPTTQDSEVRRGDAVAESRVTLGPGRHRLTVTNPLIANPVG
jgi:alpha-L-rhamnosidase